MFGARLRDVNGMESNLDDPPEDDLEASIPGAFVRECVGDTPLIYELRLNR